VVALALQLELAQGMGIGNQRLGDADDADVVPFSELFQRE